MNFCKSYSFVENFSLAAVDADDLLELRAVFLRDLLVEERKLAELSEELRPQKLVYLVTELVV
jgi:hypothetical protein